MKKVLCLVLALGILLSLCACASKENGIAGKYKNEGHFCRYSINSVDEAAYYQYYVLENDGIGHIEGELVGVYKVLGEGIDYNYEFRDSVVEKFNQEIHKTFTWNYSDGYLSVNFDNEIGSITFQKQGALFVEETTSPVVDKLAKVS